MPRFSLLNPDDPNAAEADDGEPVLGPSSPSSAANDPWGSFGAAVPPMDDATRRRLLMTTGLPAMLAQAGGALLAGAQRGLDPGQRAFYMGQAGQAPLTGMQAMSSAEGGWEQNAQRRAQAAFMAERLRAAREQSAREARWAEMMAPGSTGQPGAPQPAQQRGMAAARVLGQRAVNTDLPVEDRAILDAIAIPESGGAYNVRYTPRGGAPFAGFDAHPNIPEPGPAGPSTAAGRYQFVRSTWEPLAQRYGASDFRPETQDRVAAQWARDEYRSATGRELRDDVRSPERHADIQRVLSRPSMWTTFDARRLPGTLAAYDNPERDDGSARVILASAPGGQAMPAAASLPGAAPRAGFTVADLNPQQRALIASMGSQRGGQALMQMARGAVRPLTPQEVASVPGLDPQRAYQADGNGRITEIGTPRQTATERVSQSVAEEALRRYRTLAEASDREVTQHRPLLENLRALADAGAGGGAAAEATLGLRRAMRDTGLMSPEGAQRATLDELTQAASLRLATMLREPGSGAMSDRDLAAFRQAAPGLGQTPEGRRVLASLMEQSIGFRQARLDLMERYIAERGSLVGFDQHAAGRLPPISIPRVTTMREMLRQEPGRVVVLTDPTLRARAGGAGMMVVPTIDPDTRRRLLEQSATGGQ